MRTFNVIRVWKTYTNIIGTVNNGRVILTNLDGNVLFDGSVSLYASCVNQGFFLEGDTL